MNKIVLSLLLITLVLPLFGQNKRHEIRLRYQNSPISTDFLFNEIIDKRFVIDNIGYVQKGLTNRKVLANLKGDFEETVGDFIGEMINPRDASKVLSCIIHEFNVSEVTTFSTEAGICRITIEIAKKVDSVYYSLGSFYAEIEERKLDATGSHSDRISSALFNCIAQFAQSEWEKQEGYEIDLKNYSPNCNLENIPSPGLYSSLNRLCSNQALDTFINELNPIDYNKAERYRYVPTKSLEREKRSVMYISDGIDIYMHASRYSYDSYFIKAEAYGKFLYFEDHLSNVAGLAEASPVTALLTTAKRGIILDTTNGKIAVLTNNFLRELLADNPKIYNAYLESEQKTEDKKRAILELNETY